MSSKHAHQRAPAQARTTAPVTWNWAADLAQQQFALGTEGSALLMRGFEAMRKIQQQATQQAVQRHAAAGRKLGASADPASLIALQSELLRDDMEDAARCWQDLVGEALEVSNAWIACTTRLVNTDDVFAAARLFRTRED